MRGNIPMDILLRISEYLSCKPGYGLSLSCKEIHTYTLPRIIREKHFQILLRSIQKMQDNQTCFGKITFCDSGDCIHCTMKSGVDSIFCTMCAQYITHNKTVLF